jgi:hypothetical protein
MKLTLLTPSLDIMKNQALFGYSRMRSDELRLGEELQVILYFENKDP